MTEASFAKAVGNGVCSDLFPRLRRHVYGIKKSWLVGTSSAPNAGEKVQTHGTPVLHFEILNDARIKGLEFRRRIWRQEQYLDCTEIRQFVTGTVVHHE